MEELISYLQDPETPFGLLDIMYGIYLVYGVIRGIFRGLPGELSGILGTLITFYGAWKFYGPVSEFMLENTRLDSEAGSKALAYVCVALVFLMAWKLITWMLRKALDWTCPSQLRSLGGAVLGFGKSALVLSVILMAVDLSGHTYLTKTMITDTAFGRTTRRHIPAWLHEWMPDVFSAPTPSQPPPEADHGSGDA